MRTVQQVTIERTTNQKRSNQSTGYDKSYNRNLKDLVKPIKEN
jgi:hypothetical protein